MFYVLNLETLLNGNERNKMIEKKDADGGDAALPFNGIVSHFYLSAQFKIK